MSPTGLQRRLAAILAADVAGYSRLMAADESGTFAELKANRLEIVDPAIAGRHGRIVKLMGDGVLVEFASVVDAVECAAPCSAAWRCATRPCRWTDAWRCGSASTWAT